MNHADFIHLVRLSEHAAEEDSQAYRKNVARFAAMGYLWVVLMVLLGAALVALAAYWGTHGRSRAAVIWLALGAVALLWSGLRALWLRLDPPAGQDIAPHDAPQLFALLKLLGQKVSSPPLHRVVLDESFNASICQVPRFGLLGRPINTLSIGLPLLMSLEPKRLHAVLAHEFAHLRGDHGLLGAWIYRTRITWLRLYQSLAADSGLLAWANHGFYRWFFPRFAARSFALARLDEYEADRLAAASEGADVLAQALTEIQIKATWLDEQFWPQHWHLARDKPAPVGPYSQLLRLLPAALDASFAQGALRAAVKRLSDVADTHPVLRDRLAALQQPTQLPVWSSQSSLNLLGKRALEWVAQFDRQWCTAHASDWKNRHAYLGRMRAQVDKLLESVGRNNANEMVDLARLQLRLDSRANVRAHYERALKITPEHGGALKGLVSCLPESEHDLRMRYLETLFDASMGNRWWASARAVELLEPKINDKVRDAELLSLWRSRLKQADVAEHRAWTEHSTTPAFSALTRDDLSEYEKGELRVELASVPTLYRAWIASKNLREFPQRRCYTLFVELLGLDDESRYASCRHLEQHLTLPGQVLVLPVGSDVRLRDLEHHGMHPVFQRSSASG